jgi:hypothetical protein
MSHPFLIDRNFYITNGLNFTSESDTAVILKNMKFVQKVLSQIEINHH